MTLTQQTRPMVPIEAFVSWLASGERGMSSEAIVSHLTGVDVGTHRVGEGFSGRKKL